MGSALGAASKAPVVFVDTQVLLAADDVFDPGRRGIARAWLQALWNQRAGRVSSQVLSDYYVTVTQRFGLSAGDARAKVRRFQLWKPWQIDHRTVETAWGVEARFGMTYWDALVVASAAQSCATHVLSASLTHDQNIDGVTILNPYQVTPQALGLDKPFTE